MAVRTDLPTLLIEFAKTGTLELEYIKDWAVRSNAAGKLDNLDYIEILNAVREYERTQPQ